MEFSRNGRIAAWAGLLAYVGLYIYAVSTGNDTALLLADAAFVVVMSLFAAFVYRRFGSDPKGVLTAAILAVAAVIEAALLVTEVPGGELLSSLLLIGGILLYLYLQRQVR